MNKRVLSFLLILGILLTSCVPFPAARAPTPVPTYTPAPTYTPFPTYTPLPTDTPPPPPTYTPQPTYTPLPTYTPEPTVESTRPPTQRPAETKPPASTKPPAPTQPPAVCCSGVPASVSGSIDPICGTPNTVFTMNIWGFGAYEQVGFWVSGPEGPIAGTRQTYNIGPDGSAFGLWFTPAEFDIYDQGVYGWVFEGTASGHQAILYFKVCP